MTQVGDAPQQRVGLVYRDYVVAPRQTTRFSKVTYLSLQWRRQDDHKDTPFLLTHIQMEGALKASYTDVEKLYVTKIGDSVALADLFTIADSVTRLHANAGFPLKTAYLPQQQFSDGVVRIKVADGFVDNVEILGAPPRLRSHLKSLSESLISEHPLRAQTLERFILLANQMRGVSIDVEIDPEPMPSGGSRIIIRVKRQKYEANLELDNRAPPPVGRKVFFGTIRQNGVATGIDTARFRLIRNIRPGSLFFLDGDYETYLTRNGLKASVDAFWSRVEPNIPSAPDLDLAMGSRNFGLEFSYPLVLREHVQFTIKTGFSNNVYRKRAGSNLLVRDNRWISLLGAELEAEDKLGGLNFVDLQWRQGWDILNATQRGAPFASRGGSGAAFSTFVAEAGREQKLGQWAILDVTALAQISTQSLFVQEQCVFGGRTYGRAYEFETLFGDRCFLGQVELQARPWSLLGETIAARPYVFMDGGVVGQIGVPDPTPLPATTLMSAGGGVRLKVTKHFSAQLEASWPLYNNTDVIENSPKFYFSLEASF